MRECTYKLQQIKLLISVCEMRDGGKNVLHINIFGDIAKYFRHSLIHKVLIIVKVYIISIRAEQDMVLIINLNDGGTLDVIENIQEKWGSWRKAKGFNIMLIVKKANSSPPVGAEM